MLLFRSENVSIVLFREANFKTQSQKTKFQDPNPKSQVASSNNEGRQLTKGGQVEADEQDRPRGT